jgi:hypothetical protein
MADAQTNRGRIGFAPETAFGTTIAAAPLKTLRFTEESIAHQKNATWSNEIDQNANRTSVINISKSSAGSFTSELSFTDFESWLVAAIRAGAGSASGGITTYTNANTIKSFYLEKQLTDIGAFIGCYGHVISEFSLTLAANDIAKISFSLMGQKLTKEAATRGTGTITAPARDAAMRSGADVASILLDGSAFPCAIQSLTLTGQNNVRPKTEISADTPTAFNFGTFDLSGTMHAYFPSTTLFEAMLAHTAKSMSFSVQNTAGRFGFILPSIQFGSFTPPIGSINQDVMVDIPFLATISDDDAYTLALEVEPAGD